MNDILDNGLSTETVTSGVTSLQCDVEESCLEQLSSSSPDSCSINHSFSSIAALSPNNYTVSSSSENFDIVPSSTLVGECNTTSDMDFYSMLFDDNNDSLEDILEKVRFPGVKFLF